MRYLLVSFALGVFCAGAFFYRLRARLLCVLAFLTVPLLANGLRAYSIVVLGHLSDMRWVEQHLLFGQVFFAVVCFLSCLAVARIAEPAAPESAAVPLTAPASPALVPAAILALVAGLAGPLSLGLIQDYLAGRPVGEFATLPTAPAGWQRTPSPESPAWQADYRNYLQREQVDFRRGPDRVRAFLFSYGGEFGQGEMINAENRPFRRERWYIVSQRDAVYADGMPFRETELRSGMGQRRLIHHWYLVDDRVMVNPAATKLGELRGLLSRRPLPPAAVIIGLPFSGNLTDAQQKLLNFAGEFCRAARLEPGRSACGL